MSTEWTIASSSSTFTITFIVPFTRRTWVGHPLMLLQDSHMKSCIHLVMSHLLTITPPDACANMLMVSCVIRRFSQVRQGRRHLYHSGPLALHGNLGVQRVHFSAEGLYMPHDLAYKLLIMEGTTAG
jgi:hypothetical protein